MPQAALSLCSAEEEEALNGKPTRTSRTRGKACGTATAAIRGGEEIAQLLIGSDDPIEIARAAGTKLSREARMLAAILLPAQHPMICLGDRY